MYRGGRELIPTFRVTVDIAVIVIPEKLLTRTTLRTTNNALSAYTLRTKGAVK